MIDFSQSTVTSPMVDQPKDEDEQKLRRIAEEAVREYAASRDIPGMPLVVFFAVCVCMLCFVFLQLHSPIAC
jgi:hypothetical protein